MNFIVATELDERCILRLRSQILAFRLFAHGLYSTNHTHRRRRAIAANDPKDWYSSRSRRYKLTQAQSIRRQSCLPATQVEAFLTHGLAIRAPPRSLSRRPPV